MIELLDTDAYIEIHYSRCQWMARANVAKGNVRNSCLLICSDDKDAVFQEVSKQVGLWMVPVVMTTEAWNKMNKTDSR